ncbi:MAG: NRDE family protein [Deltaproteobacteria bacterium]|nr:NRDE family protein [Deltaproteobacteria bacterium]
MCLLAVAFRVHPDAPLIVAANRDELHARPATPLTVLQRQRPRILGGRDQQAGGTWLAVNERGVVAGLTNMPGRPSPHGRRSRGFLPLLLAAKDSAADGVKALEASTRPGEFNPCWLLVGDPRSLFYVDMTNARGPVVTELEAGLHVMENRPLGSISSKAEWVQEALMPIGRLFGPDLVDHLQHLLASHVIPDQTSAAEPDRPPASRAPCVHLGAYGTRAATVVVVPPDGRRPPEIWAADGPPCVTPLASAYHLWRGSQVTPM